MVLFQFMQYLFIPFRFPTLLVEEQNIQDELIYYRKEKPNDFVRVDFVYVDRVFECKKLFLFIAMFESSFFSKVKKRLFLLKRAYNKK